MMMPAEKKHLFVTLQTLLEGIVAIDPSVDCEIDDLALDSRRIAPGCLFFACRGTQFDGIKFASQVEKNGAVAILWEVEDVSDMAVQPDFLREITIPIIQVKNLSQKIGLIAEKFYAFPSRELTTIGITGTNGKTSCSHFLAYCLTTDTRKCGLVGTLGYGVYGDLQDSTHTTPDAITLHSIFADIRTQAAKNLVMEVSSHGLSQGRVAGVEFDLAIFTNLSRDHLDYHTDMDEYFAAKTRLFECETLKHAIINTDDEYGRKLALKPVVSGRKIAYGLSQVPENCDLHVTGRALEFSTEGIKFEVDTSWGSANIRTSLLGEFNVSNLLAVLATLLAMDIPLTEAVEQIEHCETIPGRMEKVCCSSKLPTVVIDYAHTPDALQKALSALAVHRPRKEQGLSRLWCVFGCGGDRDVGKRPEMGRIAEMNADKVIITNDNPRTENAQKIIADILAGMRNIDAISIEPDREKAIGDAIDMAAVGDIILVAGKGHEKYQVVGVDKLDYLGDRRVVEEKIVAMDEKVQQTRLTQ